MSAKAREGSSGNELQFELKYCERCGGLWLRPADGGQIYCQGCSREMAELPPASRERQGVERPRMSRGPQWGTDDGSLAVYEKDEGFDLDGGIA